MNKEELIHEVAKATGQSQKQVADIVTTALATIETNVAKGEKVSLVGFGIFEARQRNERIGRNPQTGAALKIEAKKVPAFTAGKKFKETVASADLVAAK
jgi:DNA-binding protein HU-beta